MHPAYSVILFTTLSGAGYGLLVWTCVLGALGVLPAEGATGLVALALAFVLIVAGLLASTAHLGRPERAWRAFSQWRTSWLSREGVAAIFTFLPLWLTGMFWIGEGRVHGLAWLAAAGALATVWCTGMIYQSLATIRAWAQPHVAPVYVALALATGGLLYNLVVALAGPRSMPALLLAVAAIAAAWVLKAAYWSAIDGAPRDRTVEAATGLGHLGKVRPLEPPHTQANYVMREMGYAVARKHAEKLRGMVTALLFAIPALVLIGLLVAGPQASPLPLLVATVSAAIGVAVERWLFFAEAEHVVMLYYGRDAA
jgi:DMSO reductase anchor subunit